MLKDILKNYNKAELSYFVREDKMVAEVEIFHQTGGENALGYNYRSELIEAYNRGLSIEECSVAYYIFNLNKGCYRSTDALGIERTVQKLSRENNCTTLDQLARLAFNIFDLNELSHKYL